MARAGQLRGGEGEWGEFLEFLRWEAAGFIFFELVTIGVQRASQLRGGEGE